MDSLYEYILIIFLIISFLNGIFGKKKKKEQQARQREQAGPLPAGKKPEKSDRNTLEEILGIKLPDPEDVNEKETRPVRRNNQSWDPAEEFDSQPSKPERKPVRTTFRKSNEQIAAERRIEKAKREIEAKKSEIHEINSKVDAVAQYEDSQAENYLAAKIRKKFKAPDSVRDLIIASEILKRPGKFRR